MARWCCACFDHAGCWPCRHASNPGRHQAEPSTSFKCGASWRRVARWRRTVCVPRNGARAGASMQGKRGEAATVCPASHARHRACGRIAKDSVESKPTAPAAAACVARGRRDTRCCGSTRVLQAHDQRCVALCGENTLIFSVHCSVLDSIGRGAFPLRCYRVSW